MNRQQIKELIGLAAGSFPVQGKDRIEIGKSWEEVLGRLEYQQAKDALKLVLKKAKFWPTVAEILNAVDLLEEERQRQQYRPNKKTSCPACLSLEEVVADELKISIASFVNTY